MSVLTARTSMGEDELGVCVWEFVCVRFLVEYLEIIPNMYFK